MSIIATAVKHLIAAGVTGDDLVRAIADMEAQSVPTVAVKTARQERNARYYSRKASEKRLNSDDQDVSDASMSSEPLPSPCPLVPPSQTLPPIIPQTPSIPANKRGTRLPADWGPDIEFAISIGLSRDRALREADKFRDWWPAQPGQKGVKLDWGLTWKTWCRKAAEKGSQPNAPPKPQPEFLQRHERIRQNLQREIYGDENAEPSGHVIDLAGRDYRAH